MPNYANKIRRRFGFGAGAGRYFHDWRESTRLPNEGDQALATRNRSEALESEGSSPSFPPGTTIVEVEWLSGGEPFLLPFRLGEFDEDETLEEFDERIEEGVELALLEHPVDTQ